MKNNIQIMFLVKIYEFKKWTTSIGAQEHHQVHLP